jgi:hypothetical protein
VHACELGELREVLWPWLVARGYASPPDAARLPRRAVEADPNRIREALARLLAALDEPPLPVASPA